MFLLAHDGVMAFCLEEEEYIFWSLEGE